MTVLFAGTKVLYSLYLYKICNIRYETSKYSLTEKNTFMD